MTPLRPKLGPDGRAHLVTDQQMKNGKPMAMCGMKSFDWPPPRGFAIACSKCAAVAKIAKATPMKRPEREDQ